MKKTLNAGFKEASHGVMYRAGKKTRGAIEFLRDEWAGICHDGTLTRSQRYLNDVKLALGGALVAASSLEANVLGIAGGVVAVTETSRELQHSGHAWRLEHAHS